MAQVSKDTGGGPFSQLSRQLIYNKRWYVVCFLQFPFVPFVETLQKLQLFLYSEEDHGLVKRSLQLVVVF